MNQQADISSASGVAKSLSALERENKQLKARVAELERLVVSDTLTPAFNRRHFMEELDRWCWRAHRYGGHYGLLLIDVDNLKAVNEQNGPLAGDALLSAIAKSLLGVVRRSDLVARVGGDKFAVLLDNMPEAELAGKAERTSKLMGKLKIEHQGKTLLPSISTGFTPLQPGIKPSELLARADRSMLEAKQAKGLGPLT